METRPQALTNPTQWPPLALLHSTSRPFTFQPRVERATIYMKQERPYHVEETIFCCSCHDQIGLITFSQTSIVTSIHNTELVYHHFVASLAVASTESLSGSASGDFSASFAAG